MEHEWSDGYVTVNGIRLHYYRTGNPRAGVGKPPIVLAHGITDNGLCWTRLAQALEKDYELILVDARGHGLSDAPESGYDRRDHADDLAGVIEALGLQKPVVVGHSMGGGSATALAERGNPLGAELVGRLILEDPSLGPRRAPTPGHFEERTRVWDERIARRKAMSDSELNAHGHEVNPLWADSEFPAWCLAKQQVNPNVTQFIRPPYKPWTELLANIRCPLLIITGDKQDVLIGPEWEAEIHAINPHAQIARIAGAGHNVRRDQFDEYMRQVRKFLAETGPGEA